MIGSSIHGPKGTRGWTDLKGPIAQIYPQSWPPQLPKMRWTYILFIAIHFLLTAQSTARPIGSAAGRTDAVQLLRREPSRKRPGSPSISAPNQKKQKKHRNANDMVTDQLRSSGYRKAAIKKETAWDHSRDHEFQAGNSFDSRVPEQEY